MGPRSKQSNKELILCDICGCLFTNKDSSVHLEICTQSTPLEISMTDQSNDDSSCYYHTCPHGLVFEQVLIGKLEELKIKDVPTHFPKSLRGRIVMLSPVIMTHLQISIGKPVVLEGLHVFPAWPDPTMSTTSVRVTQEVMTEMSYSEKMIKVQALDDPLVDAQTIHCNIRNIGDFQSKIKQLSDYLTRVSVGRYVTSGSRLNIDYYGRPCEVNVVTVYGVDETHIHTHHHDDSSLIETISDEVDNLHLGTVEPLAAGTPIKGKTRTPSQEQHCCVVKRFYRIGHNTKILIDNEDSSDPGAVITGPTLDDFGGFHKQIETITDAISTHLFKSNILASQGLSSPGGMLLYGPSGGGKTMLVHALAKQFSSHFMTINGAEVWSKFYGESEARLLTMMQEAQAKAPSIVFLDEVDSLCPRRETSKNEVEKRVVATLLTLLDGLTTSKKKVFIIAATNRRQDVDGAMRRPGRLDRELELGVPSIDDRQEILEKLLHRTVHSISASVLRDVAERAHGFLGADLTAVCKEATLHAIKSSLSVDMAETDLTLDAEDLSYGFQMVKPSAMKEVTLEISKVSWSDIGGQEDLKHKLRQAVEWPLKHPEAFARLGIRPPRGLLMYGPPGCSKTMIAKALAKESGLNFIAIKGPELFSKWVGESERAVREVFHRARSAAPAIVFFDEIDALAGERGSHGGGGGDVADRVLAQLLTEMDGVQALEDILVVAATNRPDRIDKALMRPGRLDRIVYVPLPDQVTREAIFSIHCRKMPVGGDVNISQLVAHTEGYSGAEVSAVCHEAALAALQENISSSCVYDRHFTEALAIVKPRITPHLMAIYDKYRAQGSAFS